MKWEREKSKDFEGKNGIVYLKRRHVNEIFGFGLKQRLVSTYRTSNKQYLPICLKCLHCCFNATANNFVKTFYWRCNSGENALRNLIEGKYVFS